MSNQEKAFPCASNMWDRGMDLRDYFAAQVIQGLSANADLNVFEFLTLAEMAYKQADAMLEARK